MIKQKHSFFQTPLLYQGLRSVDSYRYTYNGKELDKDFGSSHYDFGARIYDGRIGRWLAVDPKSNIFPSISSYLYCNNSPMVCIDPKGESARVIIDKEKHSITIKVNIVFYGNISAEQAKKAASGVQDAWNAPVDAKNIRRDEAGTPIGFYTKYKGKTWFVKFEVTSEVVTDDKVKEHAQKNASNAMNNYIRVVNEERYGNGSHMESGNSGVLEKKDLTTTTLKHEFLHITAEEGHSSYMGEDNPDIGVPRDVLVDPEKRTVQLENIDNLLQNIEEYGRDVTTNSSKENNEQVLELGDNKHTLIFDKDQIETSLNKEQKTTFLNDLEKTKPKEQNVNLGK